MTSTEIAAWIQGAAAVATFLAACVAVWATFQAPRVAALFSENLRKQSAAADESRRIKLMILATLLQHRATISHPDSVNAINLIDLAFADEAEVRGAHQHFMEAANAAKFSYDTLAERHRAIIEKIVRALMLSHHVTIADINRFYFPRSLAERHFVDNQEVALKLQALSPAANSQPTVAS